MLKDANSSRKRGLRGERILTISTRDLSRPHFFRGNVEPGGMISSKTRHQTRADSIFETKYPDRAKVLDWTWQQPTTNVRSLGSFRTRVGRTYIPQQTRQRAKWAPNTVSRRHLGYHRAKKVSGGFGRLERTAAYVPDTFSHWITRKELPCKMMSHSLSVCATLLAVFRCQPLTDVP